MKFVSSRSNAYAFCRYWSPSLMAGGHFQHANYKKHGRHWPWPWPELWGHCCCTLYSIFTVCLESPQFILLVSSWLFHVHTIQHNTQKPKSITGANVSVYGSMFSTTWSTASVLAGHESLADLIGKLLFGCFTPSLPFHRGMWKGGSFHNRTLPSKKIECKWESRVVLTEIFELQVNIYMTS